jgi:DNA processing protein
MEDLIYYAALSSTAFIGPKRFEKIKKDCGSLSSFFKLSSQEKMSFLGIRNPEAIKSLDSMMEKGEKIIDVCKKKNIKMIAKDEEAYPSRLKEIPDAPFLLYLLGEFNYSMKLVAIVGTRNTSREAEEINEWFTRELIDFNIGIVSGLAKGHDTISQKTAIEKGGYTAAVLGCGIDIIYPAGSEELYNAIKVSGAILSEYPPGTEPLRQNFPLRNRIISGLSEAVLVIQAPEKSGALITAEYAELQKKELYAIPGNPKDPRNTGSNRLIQKGAKIVLNPEEIAVDLLGKKVEKIRRLEENVLDISGEENAVLKQLSAEKNIEELSLSTGYSIVDLNHILTKLEIRSLVTQYPGRFYARNVSLG